MSEFDVGKCMFLFMIVSVWKMAGSQIVCQIEFDSAHGLWLDTTPKDHFSNATKFCTGYRYQETNITCTAPTCPPVSNKDAVITFYQNAEKQFPLLPSCATYFNQHVSLTNETVQQFSRYNKTKMCVPHSGLKTCTPSQKNKNGVCIPKRCAETCIYGRCDVTGFCTCIPGYSVDPKTNMCVMKECLKECVGGTCDVAGDCICKRGFVKGLQERYTCRKNNTGGTKRDLKFSFSQIQTIKECETSGFQGNISRIDEDDCICDEGFKKINFFCIQIVCPDAESKAFCQNECQKSECEPNNGQCENGECKCNIGYKKSANDKYQCNKISCPSLAENERSYCQSQCSRNCINGKCSSDGSCNCLDGFSKDRASLYKCNAIRCPSSADNENLYCSAICKQQCLGVCDQTGACSCKRGFEKISDHPYFCDEIVCPALTTKNHVYCSSLCETKCANGECDDKGECECHEGFVLKGLSANASCQRDCSEEGSCNAYLWVMIVFGGLGGVLIFVVIVVAGVFVRKRMREEQFKKDNGRFRLSDIEKVLPTTTPTLRTRGCETYLEPIQIQQQLVGDLRPTGIEPRGYLNPITDENKTTDDDYIEMAPSLPMQSRPHLEDESSVNEGSPIYDTPYDHFNVNRRLVRPTPPVAAYQYVNHGQALNAQGHVQQATYVNRAPDISEIRQQRKQLRAVGSPRTQR